MSLLSAASGGPISEVPLPTGATPPAPSLLWIASLSSDKDEDDEVLASQTPLASAKGVVSGSSLDLVDVHHNEKTSMELCGRLCIAAAAALGDEEGSM
jgi:hypothetical protein